MIESARDRPHPPRVRRRLLRRPRVRDLDRPRRPPGGRRATPSATEPGLEVVFEPRVGGRIYERTKAGVEHDWGRIVVWDPPRRLVYRWHLRVDAADATEVDITFVPRAGDRTLVQIEHRGWERLGSQGCWPAARAISPAGAACCRTSSTRPPIPTCCATSRDRLIGRSLFRLAGSSDAAREGRPELGPRFVEDRLACARSPARDRNEELPRSSSAAATSLRRLVVEPLDGDEDVGRVVARGTGGALAPAPAAGADDRRRRRRRSPRRARDALSCCRRGRPSAPIRRRTAPSCRRRRRAGRRPPPAARSGR